MGGKTKQAQRTKNNARPSSSGRSAEILGSSISSFVGFTSHADLGIIPHVPGFSTIESLQDESDLNIDSQFQLVLRKMSKKDPVTKVKALQEFTLLISTADQNIIKTILPIWPKIYSNLSVDLEHRVRESCQQSQAALADKAGKNIAPFLKQIVPIWIASRFDNYAPSASIAYNSFKKMFSDTKMHDVLIFCQNEIIDYVIKNLTSNSQNSSKGKSEDEEKKDIRLILCSLRTYALFFEKAPIARIDDALIKNEKLLSNPKFWSYAKHKMNTIRSAWFEALYAILNHTPHLLANHKQQAITLIFQNMDSSDSSVQSQVWGCILLLQINFNDWSKFINFQKVIMPKLLSTLKTEPYTCDINVYPNILPFISKLLPEQVQPYSIDDIYKEIFISMKYSFTKLPTALSKAYQSAIITTFFECLKFVIEKKAKEETDISLSECENLFNENIAEVIKWAITTHQTVSKYIFTQTAHLILYWTKNNKSLNVYSKLLEKFWSGLLELLKFLAKNEESDTELKHMADLIQALYNSNRAGILEAKVRFKSLDKDETGTVNKANEQSILDQEDLKSFGIELAKVYVERTSKHKITTYLEDLKALSQMFGDFEFYSGLTNSNTPLDILHAIIEFLKEPGICSENVIELVFAILPLVEKQKQAEYIQRMLLIPNNSVQDWVLHRLLSYPFCMENFVKEILSQKKVSEIILRIAKEFVNDDSNDKINLLHKCFFQVDSEKTLISKDTIEGIVSITSEPLENDKMVHKLDKCGSFLSQIMPVICLDFQLIDLKNLLFLKLFKISINKMTNENLSEDTIWEITTCWQDALSSNDLIMSEDLFEKCIEIIINKIYETNSFNIEDIKQTAYNITKLILCSTENGYNENSRNDKINLMIEVLFNNKNFSSNEEDSNFYNLFQYIELLTDNQVVMPIKEETAIDIKENYLWVTLKRYFLFLEVISELTCTNSKNKENIAYINDDSDDVQIILSDPNYIQFLHGIQTISIGDCIVENNIIDDVKLKSLLNNSKDKITSMLSILNENFLDDILKKLFILINSKEFIWSRIFPYFLTSSRYKCKENGPVLLYEDILTQIDETPDNYINILKIFLSYLPPKVVAINQAIFVEDINYYIKFATIRCLITNHFNCNFNEVKDRKIITLTLSLLDELALKQATDKSFLLYNTNIYSEDIDNVMAVVEIANVLVNILEHFPRELSIKNWDFLRLAISSWILSISKSLDNYLNPKVSMFISSIYKLYKALRIFILEEKSKSSSALILNIIDEWENLFSNEVNLVIFNGYYHIASNEAPALTMCYKVFLTTISSTLEFVDYNLIANACLGNFILSLDDVISFEITKLNSRIHAVRTTAYFIIKQLIPKLVSMDMEKLEKQSEQIQDSTNNEWHTLHKFYSYLKEYESCLEIYLNEFSYKLTELSNFTPIIKHSALSYVLLWDCMIYACSKAPSELRSAYASYIIKNQLEEKILHFIFRAMPSEILKNFDSKIVNAEIFNILDWTNIKDPNITVERYVCHLYAQMLRFLPAVVRKWWTALNARQKTFVDKLTTNYVSSLICQEDLRAIIIKKDKHENMQVTVHNSTREVIAIYAIDEARIELVITLANNHPLGPVKVESGKQIGGKLQSRVLVMQLSIFLTHQNGSIFDGLTLWKSNLDKKFEGVEECYVCYSVIHQDTCQLPKLSCKTCRKKFHGPCMYKWFTTSSKSTCPICRNVF